MSENSLQTSSFHAWPETQLESVSSCPVCGSLNSRILEPGLIDNLSHPPTGLWVMKHCEECGIAYLANRPGREFIKNAYSNYYTHTSEKDDLVKNYFRTIKNFLSEKYYAVKSGSGGLLDYIVYLFIRMLVPVSWYFDAKSRHLFKVKAKPGKLLDIGCGNGEFLKFADRFGWQVVGVDFDENAVSAAKSGGFDVRHGDVNVIDSKEKFDFISLSHIIEHVYDPADLLRSCYALLNDGGVLWLETPNVESMGYVYYKSNWRGLEPPRHIMLFNQASLFQMLLKSGFQSVEQKNHGLSGVYMGLSSERLLNKAIPCESGLECFSRKIIMLVRVFSLELIQLSYKKRREFLTLIATR